MVLGRAVADVQALGDLAVLHPAGDQPQDVELARRELLRARGVAHLGGRSLAPDRAEHDLGCLRRQPRAALRRGSHGCDDVVDRHVLREEATRAGLHRCGDRGWIPRRPSARRPASPDARARISRVASGPSRSGMRRSIRTTSGCNSSASRTPSRPPDACATTSMSGSAVEQRREPGPEQIVIVHDQTRIRRSWLVADHPLTIVFVAP